MSITRYLCLLVFTAATMQVFAQAPADANTGRPLTDDDIAVLRQDIQADKTDIITRSMEFTPEQSTAFWPVYRDYAHEQQKVGDDRVALIKDYAANYDKIDDTQADSYIQRYLKYEDSMASLRKKYVPRFKKAIGAKQTAKFLQVDNRLTLLANVQLAALLPIIK
ncbi:hypothetical protein [Edaphobacter sp. HDX4]|uniref:hypothetical protein n=1 Tax=Edaphobacter sp. HDX4 TaxID=2794064 RepID=UPI002FE5EBFF